MAENKLNFDNLTENMFTKMEGFNNEGVDIELTTIHNEVLSKTDGFKGVGDSASLYKGSILWTIWANGGNKVAWPAHWLTLSVKELADIIILKQKYPTT